MVKLSSNDSLNVFMVAKKKRVWEHWAEEFFWPEDMLLIESNFGEKNAIFFTCERYKKKSPEKENIREERYFSEHLTQLNLYKGGRKPRLSRGKGEQ